EFIDYFLASTKPGENDISGNRRKGCQLAESGRNVCGMAGRRPWSQPIPKVLRAGTGIVRPWVQGEAEDRGKGAAEPQAKTAEPARVRKRAAPLHHPGRGRSE